VVSWIAVAVCIAYATPRTGGRDSLDGIFSRKVVERVCKKKLCEWLTAKFP